MSTSARVKQGSLNVDLGDQWEAINLIVEPLQDTGGPPLFVIAFQDLGVIGRAHADAVRTATDENDQSPEVEILTRDLFLARERLRAVSEELEEAAAEAQSSNEEYLSINEELQSANEELETSKEELQSLNEVLQTINAELNNRNDSLVRSNSDLANLFDSTSIATLFVDKNLLIRRFTPSMRQIFNLRDGDEGRPIGDIVTRLTEDSLESDLRESLGKLTLIEREVAPVRSDISYLMQVRPYRDVNNQVDGAVITFIDISERKAREQAQARLASIVESSQDAIISHDLDGNITSWNLGAEYLYGYQSAEVMGRALASLLHDALPDAWPDVLIRLQAGEQVPQFESERTAKDGKVIQVAVTVSPVLAKNDKVAGAAVVARDISARLLAERRSALLLGELDHRVKNILAVVSVIVSQTIKSGLEPVRLAAEIEGRIAAITKAHSLLTNSGQGIVSLKAILTTELAAYDRGNGNVLISGPGVALTPRAGMALAMAFHELASNAAKFGALSSIGGRLAVASEAILDAAAPTLTIIWMESGGPPVTLPTRSGFGTTLIEQALIYEFDAEVSRQFLPEGLWCTITLPLTPEIGHIQSFDEGRGNS